MLVWAVVVFKGISFGTSFSDIGLWHMIFTNWKIRHATLTLIWPPYTFALVVKHTQAVELGNPSMGTFECHWALGTVLMNMNRRHHYPCTAYQYFKRSYKASALHWPPIFPSSALTQAAMLAQPYEPNGSAAKRERCTTSRRIFPWRSALSLAHFNGENTQSCGNSPSMWIRVFVPLH